MHPYQPPVRLSESLLWYLQRASYQSQGPAAWRPRGVPLQILSNPYVARAYAEVIYGYLGDLAAAGALDPAQPTPILDLGAGSGRFGFYLARALDELAREDPAPAPRWRLILTDLARSNLDAWAAHPRLQPWLERGDVQIARFDAQAPGVIAPIRGAPLDPASPGGPVVAVANYFFDSIPQDAFWIAGGALYEHRVALETPTRPSPDDEPGALLAALSWRGQLHPTTGRPYREPLRDELLAGYAASLDRTTVLFPAAALECVDHLAALGGGDLLLLASDKGHVDESGLADRAELPLIRHGGTFSLSVNFDAIGRYVQGRGGQYAHSPAEEPSLATAMCRLGDAAGDAPRTRRAFARRFSGFSPLDYQRVRNGVLAMAATPAPDVVLGLLRLSRYDPVVFTRFKPALVERSADLRGRALTQLRIAAEATWQNRFRIAGDETDLAFELASLFQIADRFEDALGWYARSLADCGEHVATRHNMALCREALGQNAEALAEAEAALALAPDYAEGRALRERLGGA